MAYDSGFYGGDLVSLAGIKSKRGYGLKTDYAQITTPVGLLREAIPSNPRRVYLIIQNVGTGTVGMSFGGSGTTVYLEPYDVLQVDKNIPWTGSITFYGLAASTINYTDVSLAASE